MDNNNNFNQRWLMVKAMASAAKNDTVLRKYLGRFHEKEVPRSTFSTWRNTETVGEEYSQSVVNAFSRFYQTLISRHVNTTHKVSSRISAHYAIFIKNSDTFTMVRVLIHKGNVYFIDTTDNALIAPLLGIQTTFDKLKIANPPAAEDRYSRDTPIIDGGQ